MKTKHLKRFFLSIAITAFLTVLVGEAFAANQNASRRGSKTTTFETQDWANDHIVVAPYWQVDSGSYTFIAVTHSSLSGMASQIGVQINAIDSAKTAYADAQSFTVGAGSTQRVFIVPTNHATVNSTNISSAVFLAGTTDFTYGHIRVNPVAQEPQLKFGGKIDYFSTTGAGFRDATMLSYWGSVIIEANTTGFAMEFVGDMNDSTSAATHAIVGYQGGGGPGPNLQ